jgi:hypothetical protein
MFATVDGTTVYLGDTVCFKRGVEQYGRITAIRGGYLTLAVYDSDTGENDSIIIPSAKCWID